MYRLTGYKVKEEIPIEIGSVDLVAPKKGIDSD